MKDKSFDAYRAPTLTALIESLNRDKVKKEDIVNVFGSNGEFIAIIYN